MCEFNIPQFQAMRLDLACLNRDNDELKAKLAAAEARLAEFNTEWQHNPPQIGDTKWVRMAWGGRMPVPIINDGLEGGDGSEAARAAGGGV